MAKYAWFLTLHPEGERPYSVQIDVEQGSFHVLLRMFSDYRDGGVLDMQCLGALDAPAELESETRSLFDAGN